MIEYLIIGAGPSGLCAAKTLLQCQPDAEVLLLEARPSLGGVWSKEQLYPTLKTNNLHGTVDFADFPMDPARFGVAEGEHIPGEVMNAYLMAYAEHFGLTGRIRFNKKVAEVRRREKKDGWVVEVVDDHANSGSDTSGSDRKQLVVCRKLMVATGVLSGPHLPELRGSEKFDAPYIHSADLAPQAETIFGNDDNAKRQKKICVLGGSKSSYDSVYLACSRGHRVEWVIRSSGRGPSWVFPSHTYLGPIRAWREKLILRRFFTFMSPCVFPDLSGMSWLRRFLHSNPVGRVIRRGFWAVVHHDTLRDCGYRGHPALNVLEPEQSPFWYGTASGVLNYEIDIHEFIRTGQVQIHRSDISHLSSRTVHLCNGHSLRVDSLVASTGYSAMPTVTFSPPSTHSGLGIPSTSHDEEQRAFWASLSADADATMAAAFPSLAAGPPPPRPLPTRRPGTDKKKRPNKKRRPGSDSSATTTGGAHTTPWRLYRGIAPPGPTAEGDRSLVFVGAMSNTCNTLRLEAQCLWAVAYLTAAGARAGPGEGSLIRLPGSPAQVYEQTALLQRWARLRSPLGHGGSYPDLSFDQMPYWDVLLHDLGLETARKRSWWRELFEPYGQADYKRIVEEWLERNRLAGA